jgi:L-amino acid N-acyltransferase YncA
MDRRDRLKNRRHKPSGRAGHPPATVAAAVAVAGIYNRYVAETTITFEEVEVPPQEIARRVEEVSSASLPWLAAEQDGRIVGYAYAARWHSRSAFRFSVDLFALLRARAVVG